ncbi:MAG: hypothetical protein LZ173_08640 [Thaumarchaeota archaeon]|nr:hypothetical protein [Candidatus Geocrenenecus arthurdayi]
MICVYVGLVGVVESRHPIDTGLVEVFKQMARDLAGFFKGYCGEVEGGVMEDG